MCSNECARSLNLLAWGLSLPLRRKSGGALCALLPFEDVKAVRVVDEGVVLHGV